MSPCGSLELPPSEIARLLAARGVQVAALTDHNTCGNCESAMRVGESIGLTVVPGMELCTAEEIHCVCLFPDLKSATAFSDYVHEKMPDVQNQPEIFGEQCKMDEGDGIVGYEPLLLTTAADISIDDVAPLVKSYGGACFPAHLDRASYSVLSVLGFLYPELNFTAAEFTPKAYLPQYLEKHPLLQSMHLLRNSDAHYLENMTEPLEALELKDQTAQALIDFLNNT